VPSSAVKGFNGAVVNNLAQLAQLVDSSAEEYLRFELDHDVLVVLRARDAHAATKDILLTHCIPSAKSEDLLR
jgi:hypothetical protein